MLGFPAQRELPTVLLIDDDLVSREVLATILTMSGYTVHTAVGGAESLNLLSAGECVPQVILMDARMPGLNGTRLIAQLRERTDATVYAISGSKVPHEVAAACDGFLLKPFGPDDLGKLLKERETTPAPPASPADGPAAAVVDAETLAKLRALMPEHAVRQIYASIVADLGKRLDTLEAAIASGDAAAVRAIGHAIKGGCGMAGAAEAARLGALLEAGNPETGRGARSAARLHSNQLNNNSTVLRELRAAVRNLESMLEVEFPA